MTFIYECDPYYPEMYRGCISMNFLRQGFRHIQTDRQTRRFAGGQKYCFVYLPQFFTNIWCQCLTTQLMKS